MNPVIFAIADVSEATQSPWWSYGDGPLEPTAQVLGLPIFWWGRLGKTLNLVGSLLIVIEIIGVARLRQISAWLSRVKLFRRALNALPSEEDQIALDKRAAQEEPGCFIHFIYLQLAVMSTIPAAWVLDWMLRFSGSVLWGIFCSFAAIFLAFVALPLIPFLAVELLLIRPMVFLLSHPRLDFAVKCVSLLLFSTGWFLEMLCS
jgi:hypothetical protein